MWKFTQFSFMTATCKDMINYPYIYPSMYCQLFQQEKKELYSTSFMNFLRDYLLLKGHLFGTALLKTCEDITTSLNSKEHTAAVTIDLSRAFKISLDILLRCTPPSIHLVSKTLSTSSFTFILIQNGMLRAIRWWAMLRKNIASKQIARRLR